MSEFALEAARRALLEAQAIQQSDRERGAELEVALDRERTGRLQAEERIAGLEGLIAKHEHTVQTDSRGKLCPECACAKDDGWRPPLPPHTPDCPWGQAAANHRARQAHAALAVREPVEGRDFERMPEVA